MSLNGITDAAWKLGSRAYYCGTLGDSRGGIRTHALRMTGPLLYQLSLELRYRGLSPTPLQIATTTVYFTGAGWCRTTVQKQSKIFLKVSTSENIFLHIFYIYYFQNVFLITFFFVQ